VLAQPQTTSKKRGHWVGCKLLARDCLLKGC